MRTIPDKAPLNLVERGYQRVDLERLEHHASETGAAIRKAPASAVRWMIIPLSALFCVFQAVATILAANMREIFFTSTMIPILTFGVLFLLVLLVNPLLRVVQMVVGKWARPLNRLELVCLFTAMLVTSGISTFGLAGPLVPLLGGPKNPEWNTPARGWNDAVVPSLNPKLYIQDRDEIKAFRNGVTFLDSDGNPAPAPRDNAPLRQKLDYGWKVFKVIPWNLWITPLTYWMTFVVACYGIFYCLTYIVLSYWSEREKLIFPLARFFELIMPETGAGRYRIPRLLTTPGFWIGFSISFLFLAINAAIVGWFKNKGLEPIPLGMSPHNVEIALKDSIFQGITTPNSDNTLRFLIMFSAIGIAFLLPLEVSFSVWFYYLVGRFILLISLWFGYGTSLKQYPSDILDQTNAVTSLGGGGFFLFSAICLFRCIRDYVRMVSGKSLGQRCLIAMPVLGLLACIAVLVYWLHWNHLPVMWALVFVACLTLLTIGLMRIVAESGIYRFQVHAGFFHLFKILGAGKILAPALLAPLLPIYSVLFLETNAFMAPNLLNAAEMEKHSRSSRWKFHLNLVLCIALSVVVSLAGCIYLAHLRGGNRMESWFYNQNIPWLFSAAQRLFTAPVKFGKAQVLWYAAGALWVALTVFLRASFFWFPHPIGFIMLVNPLMTQLWFSFFLGWVFKRAVVRYGGKATYDRVLGIFIGLIAGELIAIIFWAVISLWTGANLENVASLNRYV